MKSYLSDDEDDGHNTSGSAAETKYRDWFGWKEDGKRAYERGDYNHALESYRKALRPEFECPTKADQAVLWSNVVACRLQLVESSSSSSSPGEKDLAQARAAVEDAKQCVALNPNWAKGHLRLASAYIALGGHSNDACNELQAVLRIDPGNSNARQMLVRELRRDHRAASAAASSSTAVDDDNVDTHERDPPSNPNYVPPGSTAASSTGSAPPRSNNASTTNTSQSNNNINTETYIDDGLTWKERIAFYWARVVEAYQNLNPDIKTCLKISVIVLVLYVAFGGRFGLGPSNNTTPGYEQRYDTGDSTTRGNYGSNNAYDEYYRQKQRESRGTHRSQNDYFQRQRKTSTSYDDDYYYDTSSSRSNRNSGGSGFRLSNLFDGSFQSIAILGGIAYMAHRNGINPLQAIWMLNLVAGGGQRRHRHRYGGHGGYRRHRRRGGFGW